ncbi:MAG TPA: hypothetical protein VI110_11900 [Lapillicoccus sp.]
MLAGARRGVGFDRELDVVALLRMGCERVESEIREREGEGGVRVGSAASGRVVADDRVVDSEQFRTGAGRRVHGEDDVCGLAGVEPEEVDLELAAHVRLVVDLAVERDTVDLDRAVGTGRVRRGGGEGDRSDADTAEATGSCRHEDCQ